MSCRAYPLAGTPSDSRRILCPARGDQCLRRVVGRYEQSLCRADDRLSLRRRQRWRFDSCASSSQIAFVRWIGDQADSLRSEIALRTAEFILAMIETWNHVAGPRDDVMDVEGAVDAHSDQPAPAALTSLAGRGTGPGPRSRHCSQERMLRRRHVRRRSAPPPEGSGPSCSPMGGPWEVLKRVGRRAGEMPRMDRRLRERHPL